MQTHAGFSVQQRSEKFDSILYYIALSTWRVECLVPVSLNGVKLRQVHSKRVAARNLGGLLPPPFCRGSAAEANVRVAFYASFRAGAIECAALLVRQS